MSLGQVESADGLTVYWKDAARVMSSVMSTHNSHSASNLGEPSTLRQAPSGDCLQTSAVS